MGNLRKFSLLHSRMRRLKNTAILPSVDLPGSSIKIQSVAPSRVVEAS